jgi:hypothetical protein
LFEFPTVAAAAAALSTGAPDAEPPILRVERTGQEPISFGQEIFYRPEAATAKEATEAGTGFTARFTGQLSVPALERAVEAIVRRHEILRTVYAQGTQGPVQRVEAPPSIRLPVEDLRSLQGEALDAAVRGIANQSFERVFDLGRGPMFRFFLLRTRDDEHLLIVILHHIAADGISLLIFFEELRANYTAFAAGRASPLAELPVQVVDYAVWQRRRFDESVLEQHRQYWRDQLGTAPRAIALPFDRPWDGQNIPAHFYVCLDGERHARLVASAAHEGGVFFTLWSAFVATLHAWTGARDMAIGTWRAYRDRAETEQLIGNFVNFMALRMRVRENETFSQLRTRIRPELLNAFRYSELSYGEVIRTLEVPPTPGRNPLCNVAFQIAGRSLDAPAGPTQITFAGLPIPPTTVRVNISVETFVSSESLTFVFIYNACLFDQSTIESLARLYVRVVEQFSDDPDRKVGSTRSRSAP